MEHDPAPAPQAAPADPGAAAGEVPPGAAAPVPPADAPASAPAEPPEPAEPAREPAGDQPDQHDQRVPRPAADHSSAAFRRTSWVSEANRHLRSMWAESPTGELAEDDPLRETGAVSDPGLLERGSWATRLNARVQDVWMVMERQQAGERLGAGGSDSDSESEERPAPRASWASTVNREAQDLWQGSSGCHVSWGALGALLSAQAGPVAGCLSPEEEAARRRQAREAHAGLWAGEMPRRFSADATVDGKPLDASDVDDLDQAKREIAALRHRLAVEHGADSASVDEG